MNVSQLKVSVKDNLSAGGGENAVMASDSFWSDREVVTYINRGYRKVANAIRRAKANYFVKALKSTDAAFSAFGTRYVPSASLKMTAGVGEYTLPPDFVKMVGIWDARGSGHMVTFQSSSTTAQAFKDLYNIGDTLGVTLGTLLYDIVGSKLLFVRPKPTEDIDIMILYERALQPLNEYSVGTVSPAQGTNIVLSAGADLTYNFNVGDELIVGTPAAVPDIDVSQEYPVIKSLDIGTGIITLDRPYHLPSQSEAKYIRARVPEIPYNHRDAIVYYATYLGFSKGTNPSQESAANYLGEFQRALLDVVADVEMRQDQDLEFTEAYLEDII